MARVGIPVSNDPTAEVIVRLDGVNYTIATRYNTRSRAWYLDVLTEDGETALVSGRRIVVEWPLVGVRETNPDLPPGMISALDTSGHSLDPTLDDLGTRVLLLYDEAA